MAAFRLQAAPLEVHTVEESEMGKRHRSGMRWVGTLALGLGLVASTNAEAALGKRQLQVLHEQVLPAYHRGNTLQLLNSLSSLTQRLPAKKMDELDAELSRHGVPPASQLLVSARIRLLLQNPNQRLPRPKLRELVITLDAIADELDELVKDIQTHPAMTDPLPAPESIEEYESLLWEVHVLEQRLLTSSDLAGYADGLAEQSARMQTKSLTDDELAVLATDFNDYQQRVNGFRRELAEREIELRWQRILEASSLLKESDDIRGRIFASWAIDMDGELLQKEIQRRQESAEPLTRTVLAEADFAGVVAEGRQQAGDMLVRSRLLFEGLHWWLRGRYGKGPDGNGLLKSPQSLSSPQARFALFMPRQKPKPTNPLRLQVASARHGYETSPSAQADEQQASYAVPEIDRRHHYIWAWEYRQADRSRSTTKRHQNSQRLTNVTELSGFY